MRRELPSDITDIIIKKPVIALSGETSQKYHQLLLCPKDRFEDRPQDRFEDRPEDLDPSKVNEFYRFIFCEHYCRFCAKYT